MAKRREAADVRREREAREAKQRKLQEDEVLLRNLRDRLTELEKKPEE